MYTDIADFAYLHGQVLLILALEHTNNLVTFDIEESQKAFEGLKLISYPGKNVGDLVKDYLKYLRISNCLPYIQQLHQCNIISYLLHDILDVLCIDMHYSSIHQLLYNGPISCHHSKHICITLV